MPLSEHELRTLEQLEAQLSAEDPKFASAMQADPERTRRRRRAVFAATLCLGGLLLTALGTYFSLMWLGLLGMLVIAVAALFAVQAPARRHLHVVESDSFDAAPASAGAHPASRGPHLVRAPHTPRTHQAPGLQRAEAPARRPRGEFMQRLEERWDRRRRENQGW